MPLNPSDSAQSSLNADAAASGDSRTKLSRTSVALHWTVAISMIGMLFFGLYLDDLERGDAKTALVALHKSLGSLILFLVIARIWWRTRQGALQPLGNHPHWQHIAARASHHVLLFGTLAMPLSGLLRSIGRGRPIDIFGFPFIPQIFAEKNEILSAIGSTLHEWIAYALLIVITGHILAALKHFLIDGDGTLQRMLGARVGQSASGKV
ncbi:MAG: cytochrome b [Hyphomicrobiaceae bacterium]|nr:cytochrome b [Hyphomicrobiaceae bacterium]